MSMSNEQGMMPEAIQGVSEKVSGAFESVKEAAKSNTLVERFHEWKYTLLDWGIYLGIGFIVGFLIKKYLKYILLLVLFIVSLVILEQFDVLHLTIDWAKIQELFNIRPASTAFDAQVLSSYIDWVKANFAIVLSTSIGFILGLKLG